MSSILTYPIIFPDLVTFFLTPTTIPAKSTASPSFISEKSAILSFTMAETLPHIASSGCPDTYMLSISFSISRSSFFVNSPTSGSSSYFEPNSSGLLNRSKNELCPSPLPLLLDTLVAMIEPSTDICALRDPKLSKAPACMRLSIALRFISPVSILSQKSASDLKGPLAALSATIASAALSPTFFTAASPIAIAPPSAVKYLSDLFTSGGSTFTPLFLQ